MDDSIAKFSSQVSSDGIELGWNGPDAQFSSAGVETVSPRKETYFPLLDDRNPSLDRVGFGDYVVDFCNRHVG